MAGGGGGAGITQDFGPGMAPVSRRVWSVQLAVTAIRRGPLRSSIANPMTVDRHDKAGRGVAPRPALRVSPALCLPGWRQRAFYLIAIGAPGEPVAPTNGTGVNTYMKR